MISSALASFLAGSVRTATPLAYAALGELVTERSGVINIGLEGVIIGGAFGSVVFAQLGGIAAGFAGAVVSGVLVAAVFAAFVITLRADQIITGTAISMLGLGLTGALYGLVFGSGGVALRTPTVAPVPVPVLSGIPVVGPMFFFQPVVTYVLYLLVPLLAWWIHRSSAGLALRAVGERPDAAAAAGISPAKIRWWAILFGGGMGGF